MTSSGAEPDSGWWRRELLPWRETLGLLAVSLLALPGTLLGREIFDRDVDLVWAAQLAAVARAVAEGAWPFWDSRNGFGQPLLANPNLQILYPPAWLGVLLPPGPAYLMLVHLHLLLAGLGVRALALRLGRGQLAAWLAGALFVASGPTLSFVNLWHHLAGLAWAPWLLWLADRTLCEPSRGRALAWGSAAAVQLFAGSPDLCLLTHLCTLGLAVFRLVERRNDGRSGPRLSAVALAALLALGLSAVQWLPTLELVSRSARRSLPSETRLFWSLSPQAVAQIGFPIRFELLERSGNPEVVAALFELWNPLLASLYVGPLTLALAAVGLAGAGRARLALGGLCLLALVLALGRHTPAYETVALLVPPLHTLRHPSKFATLIPLGLALLAAEGFERLKTSPARVFLAALAVWVVLGVGLAASGSIAPSLVSAPSWSDLCSASGAALTLAAGLVVAAVVVIQARGEGQRALAALIVLVPLAFNHSANPTAPPGFMAQRPRNAAVVRALAERAYVWDYAEPGNLEVPGLPGLMLDVRYEPRAEARVLALREYLLSPSAGRWGISGSYERDLMGLFDPPQRAAVTALRAAEGTPAYLRLLQRGGVGAVLALHAHGHQGLEPAGELSSLFQVPIRAYRVPDPLPRVFAVGGVRSVASDEQGVALLAEAEFDPRREVALAGAGQRSAPDGFAWQVRTVERRAGRLVVEAELTHLGHLVVLESWDPGWQARADGTPVRVERANGIFRAVEVSPGRHRVELLYRPRSFLLGASLSLLSMVLAALTHRMRQ